MTRTWPPKPLVELRAARRRADGQRAGVGAARGDAPARRREDAGRGARPVPARCVRARRRPRICASASSSTATCSPRPRFEAIELSPVAPLGMLQRGADQPEPGVSALRATEIVADPTNVLALECAAAARRCTAVHLATSQRVIRAQPVPKLPGYAPHFRIFVLASAGSERKDHAFTVAALVRHIRRCWRRSTSWSATAIAFGARRVDVLATPARAASRTVAARPCRMASSSRRRPRVLLGRHSLHAVGHRARRQRGPAHRWRAFDWLAKLTRTGAPCTSRAGWDSNLPRSHSARELDLALRSGRGAAARLPRLTGRPGWRSLADTAGALPRGAFVDRMTRRGSGPR